MFDQSSAALAALRGPSAGASRLAVIHNPVSGSQNEARLRAFVQALAVTGLQVVVHTMRYAGDTAVVASALRAGGSDIVCVAGGDGTVAAVLNALPRPMPAVAILPLGTANVLAAELGLPRDPARLASVIARGATREVHLPVANGRRFTLMTGVGFDAHVVAAVDGGLKRRVGKAAYLEAFARTLWRYGESPYVVEIDGVQHDAASVIVANGRFYGGRFTCAPDARVDEPDLRVCLFRRADRASVLGCGLALLLGRLHRRRDVTIVRGREVTIFGRPGEPVQCDGDISASLPLRIRATGETARIVAPPA